MKRTIILFVFIMLLQSCATHKAAFKGQPFKFYDKVKEAGFDQNKLTELTEYIDKNSATTGLMVLHNGKVVYNYGNLEKVSYIASCRKSVLSMLYGKYVDNGTIDLKTTIGELGIDEKDGLLPKE